MSPAAAIGAAVLGALAAVAVGESVPTPQPAPARIRAQTVDPCKASTPDAYCAALAWQRAGEPSGPPHPAHVDPLSAYQLVDPSIQTTTPKRTSTTKTRTQYLYRYIYRTRTQTQPARTYTTTTQPYQQFKQYPTTYRPPFVPKYPTYTPPKGG